MAKGMDWEKANRDAREQRARGEFPQHQQKRKKRPVHPNSTAAKKWGRRTWLG